METGGVSRAEHEAFSDFMKAENKRLEDENNKIGRASCRERV